MKHKRTRRNKPRQNGGMKFGSEFKRLLMEKISSSSGVAAAANTLDKLIIQTLFENATDFDIVSDKSRYSIVFRVGIPENFLLDTTRLSLEDAVDKPGNDDKGDVKKSFCVKDFKSEYNSYKGNAYGMANTLLQTAVLRPKLKSKKVKNLYFTGQLTVPGPGVPPALISGKLVSQLIKKYQ